MRWANWGVVVGLVAMAWAGSVMAQNTTIVQPLATGSANTSSTIAATGVFQRVFALNRARKGCAVQNNGAANMWVTTGVGIAGSSTAVSLTVVPGDVFHCTDTIVTLTGEIDITGTSGDAYYAAQY